MAVVWVTTLVSYIWPYVASYVALYYASCPPYPTPTDDPLSAAIHSGVCVTLGLPFTHLARLFIDPFVWCVLAAVPLAFGAVIWAWMDEIVNPPPTRPRRRIWVAVYK